ncbi:hypothetical protein BJV78DRAFT_1276522 [Lactifluus subvellereus]|nr:hypothetical protein BJV78DRAFT_1276522 [Lactifluus subvellereus]
MGGKKRKADEAAAAIATSIEDVDLPNGWMEKLLALGPNLAGVLAALANEGKISDSQFKKARIDLPSFSSTQWSELAPNFGLSKNLKFGNFDSFSIPAVFLPLSFHETTAKVAWCIQDVYQEQHDQERETRVRLFDTYIIPIVGLFQGRVIDMPEQPMSTAYSSGGEVEHELIMIGGILFFVIKMKFGSEREDNIAQLFLELLSAAEMNKQAKFEGLRVHGLLTDLQCFYFYSYDPIQKRFAFDEMLLVNTTRDAFIADMIHVTNKVFSIILFAYMEGLAALVKASCERPPVSPTGSLHTQQMLHNHTDDNTHSGPYKSTEQWEFALNFAMQCLSKFQEPVNSVEDVEKQSCGAIGLLTKSVCSIPRVSHYSGKEDPSTEDELGALAHCIVHTEYTTLVGTCQHD